MRSSPRLTLASLLDRPRIAEVVAKNLAALRRPPAGELGWRDISSAPHAMCVLAARFDNDCGEWIYSVVLSPPSHPFTHWRLLPKAPR